MKTESISYTQFRQGDIILFYGYMFELGHIEAHTGHRGKYDTDLTVRSYGVCINPDENIKKDFYFNSEYKDKERTEKQPTGWQFQGNKNAKALRVIEL